MQKNYAWDGEGVNKEISVSLARENLGMTLAD